MQRHLRHVATTTLAAGLLLFPAAAHAENLTGPDETTIPDTVPDAVADTPPSDNQGPAKDPDARPAPPRRPVQTWASVVVDLSEQELVVLGSDGSVLRRWDVSTGGKKTPTPTGRYRVTSKSRHTFARANPRVTMEHMVRFNGGIGFHSIPRLDGVPMATPLGERAVSHGCVRIADENARVLYRNLPIGAIIVVRP